MKTQLIVKYVENKGNESIAVEWSITNPNSQDFQIAFNRILEAAGLKEVTTNAKRSD
jgi:hypothetical protein